MNGPDDCIAETALRYQRRRDILVDGFARFGWHVDRPKASMYLWAPVPTKQKSFDFVADLLKNTGVAVVPGIGFGECGEGWRWHLRRTHPGSNSPDRERERRNAVVSFGKSEKSEEIRE